MGVFLFVDQRMLDYFMVVEYGGLMFRDGVLKDKFFNLLNFEIEESEFLDLIFVVVFLFFFGIKKLVVLK